MSNPYDELEYPSRALPQTHPDRLATLAILHGMIPAIDSPRVLELGCGDGLNLISIAVADAKSRCFGIDLAERPIARGNELIGRVGIDNVTLSQMDLMRLPDDLGEFDYIIAHGLYSWVPRDVRDKLLEVCRKQLAPNGVAFISFNAYPGAHLRQMCRQMMLYHVRDIAEPKRRVAEARNLLAFLVRSHQQEHPITQLLRGELQRISQLPDGQIFHDDLSPINEPVSFADFAAHAGKCDLQFLAESNFESISTDALPAALQTELRALSRGDAIACESYLDFLRDIPYRQTLLCRSIVKLTRPPIASDVRKLLIESALRPKSPSVDVTTNQVVAFVLPTGGDIATSEPIAKAALVQLAETSPRAIAFEELLERAKSRVQKSQFDEAQILAQFLTTLCSAGFAQFHARQHAFVGEPAARPRASALARAQAQSGEFVTTLNGATTRVQGEPTRRLLQLLDGSRDRGALLSELSPLVTAPRDELAAHINNTILQFGRAGLLLE